MDALTLVLGLFLVVVGVGVGASITRADLVHARSCKVSTDHRRHGATTVLASPRAFPVRARENAA